MENNEIIASAKYYHNLGIPVIPFYVNPQADSNGNHDKKPEIIAYNQWFIEPQTDEEFNALDLKGCNGFGIILGTKANNDYYISAIDYDTKPISRRDKETKDKDGKITTTPETDAEFKLRQEQQTKAIIMGKKILVKFPQATKKEITVNDGIHLIYWSKKQPQIDGSFHDTAALELLGYKKLCVMYPSYGYKNIGSDIIAEIPDIDKLFHDLLKLEGFANNEETEVANQLDNYSFEISKLIDLTKLEDKGKGQYQGSHPIHDSTTEKNFAVDTKYNTWFCFRHNSGGGVLQYLAMKEGLIKCDQAKKGALRGKKFKQTLELAVAGKLLDEKVLTQSEINPILLAKDIIHDYSFIVDKDTDELFYYINNGEDEGTYSNNTEQLIRREITARLDENHKARYQNEITDFILGTAPLVNIGSRNPELVAVQNGLLNVITKTLEKYTNKHYITQKLPIIFNPNVKSKTFRDFIKKVIPNKKQQKQVQQLIGHILFGKILTETCLILLGGGSNGKTILLLTIAKFLGGSKNVSSHSIQALCYDKFVTGEIKGKLANICADLPHKELMNTANFKALTSGDSVQAYVKHVQRTVSFIPTTKYIFSANQIPPVTSEEDCYAWYRRFIFADFPITFTKENSTPRQTLLDTLSTPEVFSEILNWALEGLADLIKNGDVTDKPTVAEIRLQYIKRSDSALAYFEDKVKCTNNSEDYIFTNEWFRDYANYCLENNLKPKTQGNFVNTVKDHLAGAEKTKIRPDYEYVKGEPKPSPKSAFRYVKINKIVPSVPSVPSSGTIRAKMKKNTLANYCNSCGIAKKAGTSGTHGTQKRTCYPECVNFRQPKCSAEGWGTREPNKAEVPLNCPSFEKKVGVGVVV